MGKINKYFLFALLCLSAGCASMTGKEHQSTNIKDIPDQEFALLAIELEQLDQKVSSTKIIDNNDEYASDWKSVTENVVTVSDNMGVSKKLLSFPAVYKVTPVKENSLNYIKLTDIRTGEEQSKISIPKKYKTVSVRYVKDDKGKQIFQLRKDESKLNLYNRLTGYVKEMSLSYKDNPYLRVSGFSVDISWPPAVSVDFEFKD